MNEETDVNPLAKEIRKTTNAACRMLAIREHSQKQLQEKLLRKGYSREAVKQSIVYLVEENWQSDDRFCSSFIRSRAAKGQGTLRIEMELQQHGLCSQMIKQGFIEEQIDWLALCLTTAEKKLRSIEIGEESASSEASIGHAEWNNKNQRRIKLERFLRYRGFALDEIKTTIKKCLNNRSPIK